MVLELRPGGKVGTLKGNVAFLRDWAAHDHLMFNNHQRFSPQ